MYVRDRATGELWNPHFAPTCKPLDAYECRHGLGYSQFASEKGGVRVTVRYFIPPGDDVMVWDVSVENRSATAQALTLASWAYIAATQYMLGLRPTLDGLQVHSCLPANWHGVRVTRRFRGIEHLFELTK